MNTKECIEFLESIKVGEIRYVDKNMKLDEIDEEYNNYIDKVIKRLQMWEDFKERYQEYVDDGRKIFKQLMDDFEEKYFPKEKIMRKIEIEITSEKEGNINRFVNLLKAEAEKISECPKIEYEIRWCD